MSLVELFEKKRIPVDVDKIMDQLKATAAKYGLSMGTRKMTYNSRLAQEVGLWAQAGGKGHAFHMEAFRAYFVDGKNIAKTDVLLDLVAQSGLDRTEGRRVIEERTFSSAVDSDWELSKAKGIKAVPTFFSGSARLVGAQPYEALLRLVNKASGSFF